MLCWGPWGLYGQEGQKLWLGMELSEIDWKSQLDAPQYFILEVHGLEKKIGMSRNKSFKVQFM